MTLVNSTALPSRETSIMLLVHSRVASREKAVSSPSFLGAKSWAREQLRNKTLSERSETPSESFRSKRIMSSNSDSRLRISRGDSRSWNRTTLMVPVKGDCLTRSAWINFRKIYHPSSSSSPKQRPILIRFRPRSNSCRARKSPWGLEIPPRIKRKSLLISLPRLTKSRGLLRSA